MGNATALAQFGRLIGATALLVAGGCSAIPGATPPAPPATPTSAPTPAADACAISVTDDEVGSGQLFEGEGFAPDVGLTMRFGGPDGQTLTEGDLGDLRTDARGAFGTHLFAERENIGGTLLEVSDGRCTATTNVEVPAERFPEAACEEATEPTASGGEAIEEYVAAVTADDPSAWWRFEETEGALADSAGGEPAQVVESVALGQPGFIDGSRAALLSGDGDMVEVREVRLDADFTIEAWVRLCGQDISRFDALVGRPGEAPDVDFRFWRTQLDTGEEYAFESSQLVDRSGWMHVAVTRAGDALTLYQNGQPTAAGTWDGPFPITSLGAGAAFDGQRTLEGWLDEVALYERALSAERVAAHATFAP